MDFTTLVVLGSILSCAIGGLTGRWVAVAVVAVAAIVTGVIVGLAGGPGEVGETAGGWAFWMTMLLLPPWTICAAGAVALKRRRRRRSA